MKVIITKCSDPNLWYSKSLGRVFNVKKSKTGYKTSFGIINPSDVSVINHELNSLKKIIKKEISKSEKEYYAISLMLKNRIEKMNDLLDKLNARKY